MMTPATIAAFAELGLTASVQPAFDAAWGGDGATEFRLDHRWALGALLALPSDAKVSVGVISSKQPVLFEHERYKCLVMPLDIQKKGA